jgi:protocatechuate 3,4-dioxygenase beta subunit
LLASLGVYAQPQGAGMIAGLVIQKANGEPVRKAIVTLTWHGNPRSWATAMTDGSGRFKFDDLPSGKYSISAWKDAAGNANYGGDSARQMFEYVTLAEGQKRTDIVLRMIRPAHISGTVLDEQGDPVINANVTIWTEGYPRGVRELVQHGGSRSNDRGEYRITVNDPGRYYVSAGDEFQRHMHYGGQPPSQDVYARQFYGGSTDWHRAAPITVAPGDQIRGIDLHLAPLRAFTLHGKVTGVPALPAPPVENGEAVSVPQVFVNVQLSQLSESGRVLNSMGSGAGAPDFAFQIPNVLPGRYRLSANAQFPVLPGQAPAKNGTYWAAQRLDLTADPGDITIALAPATDLKGQVRAEGFEKDQFKVTLTSPDVPHQPITATTGPQGRFTLEQVPPGIWDINAEPIPPGGYIKSMRLGKQDVLTEEMEIGPGTDAPLNIVVSARGGRVNGEILDPSVAGKRAMLVMLVPVGKFERVMSFYAFAQSDADGKFKLRGLTPGNYKLLAFEEAPPGDSRNPDLIARLEGEPVEVVEGQTVEAKAKVITAARMREALK